VAQEFQSACGACDPLTCHDSTTVCTAIPQEDLPVGSWTTNDNECQRCANGYKWRPCNLPLCACQPADPDSPGVGPLSLPSSEPSRSPSMGPSVHSPSVGYLSLPSSIPSKITSMGSSVTACTAIPQEDLPLGSWATTDNECKKCTDGYNWWPCNRFLCACQVVDSDSPVIGPFSLPSSVPSKSPLMGASILPTNMIYKSTRPSPVPTISTLVGLPIDCGAAFFVQCPTIPLCQSNLGIELSGATGANPLLTFPLLTGGEILGRDDSTAMLIGGNYLVLNGAAIEGKIIVFGDFTVEPNANLWSLVRVGAGSQIVPNNGQDVVIVGGDLDIQIPDVSFMQGDVAYGNIVHKGRNFGSGPTVVDPSTITQDETLNLGKFTDALCDLKIKSKYWADFPDTGIIAEEGYQNITFSAGTEDCVQVFNLRADQLFLNSGKQVVLDQSMAGKTALINIDADSDGHASIGNFADFTDPFGNIGAEFDSDTTASILWNFHDATDINLGCGVTGNGELRGSILIPTPCSNAIFCFPGHSGRVIVNGDFTQDKEGSEFHHYEFDPICPLPLPPSYSSC